MMNHHTVANHATNDHGTKCTTNTFDLGPYHHSTTVCKPIDGGSHLVKLPVGTTIHNPSHDPNLMSASNAHLAVPMHVLPNTTLTPNVDVTGSNVTGVGMGLTIDF